MIERLFAVDCSPSMLPNTVDHLSLNEQGDHHGRSYRIHTFSQADNELQ